MVEYKVTSRNKKALAQDYVSNHLGEDIKFQNGRVITGWVATTSAYYTEQCYTSIEADGTTRGTFLLKDIVKNFYTLSR